MQLAKSSHLFSQFELPNLSLQQDPTEHTMRCDDLLKQKEHLPSMLGH